MFAIENVHDFFPITISKIFIVGMCTTVTFTFRIDQSECQYANQKYIYDLLFEGNIVTFTHMSPLTRYSLSKSARP